MNYKSVTCLIILQWEKNDRPLLNEKCYKNKSVFSMHKLNRCFACICLISKNARSLYWCSTDRYWRILCYKIIGSGGESEYTDTTDEELFRYRLGQTITINIAVRIWIILTCSLNDAMYHCALSKHNIWYAFDISMHRSDDKPPRAG